MVTAPLPVAAGDLSMNYRRDRRQSIHRRPGLEMLADLLVKIEPVHGAVFIEPAPKSIMNFSSDHVFGVQSQRVERHPLRQGRMVC